jgi:hypothetical protein
MTALISITALTWPQPLLHRNQQEHYGMQQLHYPALAIAEVEKRVIAPAL